MRILFVHSIGRKKYGGGERWVINAASGMKLRGHHVVVAGRSHSVLLQEARQRGIATATFNILSDISLYQALKLAFFIRKHQFDVVVCKGHELLVCGMAVRWSGGKATLIRRAGSPPLKKSRKLVWRTRFFVDGVVTNTHTIREVYHQHGLEDPDLVRVIYNGLQPGDNTPAFTFDQYYPGRTIALCVGRAVGHKGYFYLIDALTQIRQFWPSLLFFVLGDGKDKNRLMDYATEKGVADMIHFAGYVHEPTPYFKGCDFFVHPSLYEGMPNAAMEAMAYGKPVIMTRVNGADELSAAGQFAWLIPAADSQAIADAVRRAYDNPEQFSEMGHEAKAWVRENFSMEKMISNLEDFIESKRSKGKNKTGRS